MTSNEEMLITEPLHDAAQFVPHAAAGSVSALFDRLVVSSPTSTALDIQAWDMDLISLSHLAGAIQRWAAAVGAVYIDSLGFSLSRALSSADSDGDYFDNVHFAGAQVLSTHPPLVSCCIGRSQSLAGITPNILRVKLP